MIMVGAGGFAKELINVLSEADMQRELVLFDEISGQKSAAVGDSYRVISNDRAAREYFERVDPRFVLGVGGVYNRARLAERFENLGGELVSTRSRHARIAGMEVDIGAGCNVMEQALISPGVRLGRGCLVYFNVTVTHDVNVGEFCELSPGATLLGRCQLGSRVSVGSGAVVLPGISIGSEAVIAAGAVVREDVPSGVMVAGVPAHIKKSVNAK